MDPEPDMLRRASRAGHEQGLSNVSWMMGADTDVPALRGLLGDRSTGAVTIGQALLTFACGTDEQSQDRYRQALATAGFEVSSTGVDYVAELNLEQLVGGVYSALPVDKLPDPGQRPGFAERARAAIGPHDQFSEPVHVAIIIGRVR
jgi:hypothetical protein